MVRRTGPVWQWAWIIRWLGRLLLRLDQRSVLHAGVGGGLVIWTVA